ncbi:hypothetical protein STCU_02170 [Strigomonas culicis]|uniref:Uncharacterized protein n=1 Tax=Strigomonas culicis TaxID=28005 RepID=S9UXQ3_9TRYP|nr:hypothetical protein STCU_04377 [Strigomonas culicis]EPY33534.1 hypothetical protein STCU_02170 [Strigomonas culicis]|eukprot:EPY29644.1 hypothetical protein STCU_04377 [Strigomonas culicis]
MSSSSGPYKHKLHNKAANKSQRFHSHRYEHGQLLVPHQLRSQHTSLPPTDALYANEDYISGLLFSINPNEAFKAKKELVAYLAPIVEPYKKMYEALLKPEEGDAEAEHTGAEETKVEVEAPPRHPTSLSGLLAAELADDSHSHAQGGKKRSRAEAADDDDDDAGEEDEDRSAKRKPRNKWLAPLETNCKGYLLLRVPVVRPTVTCPYAYLNQDKKQEKGGEAEEEKDKTLLPPHTIVLNALISHINERLFRDYYTNKRFLLKYAFKYTPVEVTCCPTLSEIEMAVELLLPFHFPFLYPAKGGAEVGEVRADTHNFFTQQLPAPAVLAEEDAAPTKATPLKKPTPARRMEKITIHLNVKNNTSFENQHKKTLFGTIVDRMLPFDKFIYIPFAKLSHPSPDSIVHCLNIVVLHSTCLLSVSKNYYGSTRKEYNLHNMGTEMLSLHNMVSSPCENKDA